MAKTMISCLLSASLILAQGSQLLLCLASHGKSPSRCTTLSTDCTTETRGMSIVRQWRQRRRKGFADDGDAISPGREVTFAPLSRQGVPVWHSLFQKERAALSCKKSPVACKARVKPVKHGPILAWYLVPLCTAMVMVWSLQGEQRFPLATFHYHSPPPAS